MPRTYDNLHAALSSVEDKKLIKVILEKASEGGELLEAALLLFEDLITETERPPILKSLDTLMEEPILSNAFKKFLRQRFCYECWEFWVDTKTFRCSFDSFEYDLEATAEAYRIFDTFVKDGADQQVNISAAQRDAIASIFENFAKFEVVEEKKRESVPAKGLKDKLNDRRRISSIMRSLSICEVDVTPTIFYAAELEIKKVLQVDCLKDFCGTDLYVSNYKLLQTKRAMEENRGYKNIHDFEILPSEWRLLMQESESFIYSENQTVIKQEQYAPWIYYIVEGTAKSVHAVEGTERSFEFDLSKGDLFGEITVFSESLRSFSTVTASSPILTVKRLYLPLIFAYFMCEPVIALRWYCLIGKHLSYFLSAVDKYQENGSFASPLPLAVNVDLTDTLGDTGCYSLLFRQMFPQLEDQQVFCECNAALEGSLRTRTVVIYITTDYFCYYYNRQGTSPAVRSYLLADLDIQSGKTCSLFLSCKRKKLLFRFTSVQSKNLTVNILDALKAAKRGPQSIESEIKNLMNSRPCLTEEDWYLLQETARQNSREELNDQEEPSSPSRTRHTFRAVYSFGDVITAQGQDINRLVRIISGSCVASRKVGDSDTRSLRVMGMHECYGETGFFSPDPAHFSLIANEDNVHVLEVSKEFVQTVLFAQNPQSVVRFYDSFCRSMVQRIIQGFVFLCGEKKDRKQ